MTAYYNDNDPKVCRWLRELIGRGLIADGDVDDRPIQEVQAHDVKSYTQCHWFAGIGGWSLACRYAGVSDETPLWTGSCPCQPFSNAGKRAGVADRRHLWPELSRLIKECRPPVVFGEQVASAIGHGWLDGVFADLEDQDYACGAAVLGAHSVGAPHIRQRLWWVADCEPLGRSRILGQGSGGLDTEKNSQRTQLGLGLGRENGRLADAEYPERRAEHKTNGDASRRDRPGWSGAVGIPCRDGKTRRIEPGLEPLAHGLPARMVRLRGYGNAIVPQVAAEFISAYLGE